MLPESRLTDYIYKVLIGFLETSFDSWALLLQACNHNRDFLQHLHFLIALNPAVHLPGLCWAGSSDVSIWFPVLNLFPLGYLEWFLFILIKPLTNAESWNMNGSVVRRWNWFSDPVLFENNNDTIAKINEIVVDSGMPVVACKEIFLQSMVLVDHHDYWQ